MDSSEESNESLTHSKSIDVDDDAGSKMADHQELSHFYLKKHRIPELFHNVLAALVYERPESPKEFMVSHINKLMESRLAKVDHPSLFDENNVRSLFNIMDPASKGFISHSQYKAGMENLGVSTFERNPAGTDEDKIALDTFINEAKTGLHMATGTFAT